jgi:hypothetical protein
MWYNSFFLIYNHQAMNAVESQVEVVADLPPLVLAHCWFGYLLFVGQERAGTIVNGAVAVGAARLWAMAVVSAHD